MNRLIEFQNNCLVLSHHHHTHPLDRWMVRLLFEYGLPLEQKAIDPHAAVEMEIILRKHMYSLKVVDYQLWRLARSSTNRKIS